jgi:aminoglycoside phosphotransferase (APT) family kinase protein
MNSSKATPIGGKLLTRIWRTHHLGNISSLSQPARPSLNPIRFVNDRFVIRFYTSKGQDFKPSQGEARAYELLANSGVPVPEVVALGFSGEVSPYDYLIMTRLPGRPLVDVWSELDKRQKKRAAHAVGTHLAQIHTNAFQRFGYLSRLDSNGYAHWYDFVYAYYSYYAAQVQKLEILEAAIFDRLQNLLRNNRALLDQVTLGALVHSSFQFKHILYQAGEITGVLDFGHALSGDPAWDFVLEDEWPKQCPGSLPWLYQRYQLRKTLETGYEIRMSLYKLLMYMVFLADSNSQPIGDGLDDARNLISALIEMLEGCT